jgi:hypothetical protein
MNMSQSLTPDQTAIFELLRTSAKTIGYTWLSQEAIEEELGRESGSLTDTLQSFEKGWIHHVEPNIVGAWTVDLYSFDGYNEWVNRA